MDDEGEVLDVVMQRKRDTNAALKLLRRLLRNQPVEPTRIVTDGGAASYNEKPTARYQAFSMESLPEDELLVNALAMLCPFQPEEKQALLEAQTLGDRRRVLETLISFAMQAGGADEVVQ